MRRTPAAVLSATAVIAGLLGMGAATAVAGASGDVHLTDPAFVRFLVLGLICLSSVGAGGYLLKGRWRRLGPILLSAGALGLLVLIAAGIFSVGLSLVPAYFASVCATYFSVRALVNSAPR